MTHKLETPTASKYDALARQRNEALGKAYEMAVENERLIETGHVNVWTLPVLKMAKANGGEPLTLYVQLDAVLKINVASTEVHLMGESGKAIVKALVQAGMGTDQVDHAQILANWLLDDNDRYQPHLPRENTHTAILNLLQRLGLEVEECRNAKLIGIVPTT